MLHEYIIGAGLGFFIVCTIFNQLVTKLLIQRTLQLKNVTYAFEKSIDIFLPKSYRLQIKEQFFTYVPGNIESFRRVKSRVRAIRSLFTLRWPFSTNYISLTVIGSKNI